MPLVGFASFQRVSGGGNALLLRTLAAAVIARMENLPRAVIAAIAIGVFENAAIWNLPRTTIVDAMLVVVILVALLVQRDFFSRAAETGISSWRAIREIRPIPEELRRFPEVRVGAPRASASSSLLAGRCLPAVGQHRARRRRSRWC